jgi:sec-independent protein translocase protein TatB
MLPEIGASELLVIAVVALIVVGPKDLPVLLRRLGQLMAKLRGMAAEFRASFDEMSRQSELDELRKEVEAMRRGQFLDLDGTSPAAEINQAAQEIESSLADVGVSFAPPMGAEHEAFQAAETAAAAEPAKPKRTRKAPAKKAAASAKTAPAKTAPRKTASAAKPATARKPRAKKIVEGDA